MITVSIVLYNTPQIQYESLINDINKTKEIEKIYIIDNSPQKNMYDLNIIHATYEYILNDNTGYGSSHNIALRKAILDGSTYHIILNPDIQFDASAIMELKEYMENHSDIVYILPKVVYPNGEIQYLCKLLPTPMDLIFRRFFPKNKFAEKLKSRYELRDSGYDKIINPPCLSGCFMFLRIDTIKDYKIFFDERYFMYLEDFDLMRRLHRVGKTVYYPYVTIIHNHAKESYKSKKMLKIHISSSIKYFT